MGPLGYQEMVFIFVLALLLFGPKKLPELGKTLGKAMTEFKRASSELKATFDRELSSLERESESIKEVTSSYNPDTYSYDYNYNNYFDSSSGTGSESTAPADSNATVTSTVGASAIEGAESHSGTAPEGTVATATVVAPHEGAVPSNGQPTADPAGAKPSNGTQPAAS